MGLLGVELSQDKGGHRRGQEAAPGYLAGPVGAGLLHAEQHTPHRRPKGCLQAPHGSLETH